MNLDAVIDAIAVFGDKGDYYFNSLGISDEKADFIMTKAEDTVFDYLEIEDETWTIPEVAKDLLFGCKFHGLNSQEAFFFLIHGMHFLLDFCEPVTFSLDNGGYVGKEGIEFDEN